MCSVGAKVSRIKFLLKMNNIQDIISNSFSSIYEKKKTLLLKVARFFFKKLKKKKLLCLKLEAKKQGYKRQATKRKKKIFYVPFPEKVKLLFCT